MFMPPRIKLDLTKTFIFHTVKLPKAAPLPPPYAVKLSVNVHVPLSAHQQFLEMLTGDSTASAGPAASASRSALLC